VSFRFTSLYFDDTVVPGRAMDMFEPAQPREATALFFVHGGGWRGGTRTIWHPIMRAFNAEGFACAAVDYRLAGVHIAEQLADVRQGFDIFLGWLQTRGLPLRVAVIGSSAGAHLAALLALAEPGECGDEVAACGYSLRQPETRPVAAILQSAPFTFEPWEDIFPGSWAAMQDIVGVPYERDPEAYRRVSPLRYAARAGSQFLVLDAANEHMFPLAFSGEFVAAVRAGGGQAEARVYANAEHGFFYDVTRRPQAQAFQDTLAFLRRL
jgi:acetyl esterase/lipase